MKKLILSLLTLWCIGIVSSAEAFNTFYNGGTKSYTLTQIVARRSSWSFGERLKFATVYKRIYHDGTCQYFYALYPAESAKVFYGNETTVLVDNATYKISKYKFDNRFMYDELSDTPAFYLIPEAVYGKIATAQNDLKFTTKSLDADKPTTVDLGPQMRAELAAMAKSDGTI